MQRTTKRTAALGTFGVLPPSSTRPRSNQEDEVLAVATRYRKALCDIYQSLHEATIEHRNRHFPELYSALVTQEAIGLKIHDLEKQIKTYHSEVRDRNAVTIEQESMLKDLRAARAANAAVLAREKKTWLASLRDFSAFWKSLADWKNVKSLDTRKAMYRSIRWPLNTVITDFGELRILHDLKERELDREYEPILHPSIRQEIKEASKPKLTKNGPGMRYRYGGQPDVRPWEKLSLQFSGGLSVADCLASRNRQLYLELLYVNHSAGGDETIYRVIQQIGTAKNPRYIGYLVKFHRPLPETAVFQRWSLIVRKSGSPKHPGVKRTVVPVCTNLDNPEDNGSGTLTYDLTWTIRKDGVEVAHIWGTHVNERLVIPNWIVDRRLAVARIQQHCDIEANAILASLGATPQPKCKQGVEALEAYHEKHSLSPEHLAELERFQKELHLSRKDAGRAGRCIEDIYKVAAHRVCRLHSSIIHDTLDISSIKRYDTRDLLREDVLPAKSREILHAVSPGKLREAFRSHDLASGDVLPEKPIGTRETDVFTTYVRSLGIKTGKKESAKRRVSRHAMAGVAAE